MQGLFIAVIRFLGGKLLERAKGYLKPKVMKHSGPIHLFKPDSFATFCGRNKLAENLMGSSLYSETTCTDCRERVHRSHVGLMQDPGDPTS